MATEPKVREFVADSTPRMRNPLEDLYSTRSPVANPWSDTNVRDWDAGVVLISEFVSLRTLVKFTTVTSMLFVATSAPAVPLELPTIKLTLLLDAGKLENAIKLPESASSLVRASLTHSRSL